MRLKSSFIILIIITSLAFFLRVHGINYYSYGDEHGHVFNSLGLASGQLPGNFHRIALFLFYGIFYVVGWVLGIFRNPSAFTGTYFSNMHVFYYVGRFFESFVGAATVPMLYLLGKKMFSRETGLIAALFLAVSPVAVELSRKARGQALCLLLIIASMYFSYTAIENKRKFILYLLSGLCFGAAFSIRIFVAIVLVPLAYFYFAAKKSEVSSLAGGPITFNRQWFLGILKKALFSGGIWLFLLGAFSAYVVSAPQYFARFSDFISRHLSTIAVGTGEKILYLGSELESSYRYYLSEGFVRALGLPLYIFSSIALIIGLFRFKKRNYPALISCVILYVLVMGRGSIAATRYLFPIFPALFLIVGDVLVAGSRLPRLSRRLQTILCFGIAVLLVLPALSMVNAENRLNRRQTTKDLAQEWIFSNFPPGTRIAVESMGYRGPDLRLTPVIDYWIYNLSKDELEQLLEERLEQGLPSFALRYFIRNPPSPKFYTSTISIREVVDVRRLIDEGYQYIVTCSGNREVYEREITRKRYPEHYASRLEFYQWLEREGELIKIFEPNEKTPGDEIRVYKVKGDDV